MNRRETLQSLLAAAAAGATSPLLSADGKPSRVAVMGHSERGSFGHGLDTVWLGFPGVEIVGVSDPVEKGRADAAKKLNLSPEAAFADFNELLEKTSPDLVAVAPRYVGPHAAMVIAAAKAGAKGIYVEKPFCRDLAEADGMIEACRENGTKLAIAHRNRYHPVLPVVRDLIEEGGIGTLLEIRARGKEDARGGCQDLWVLGSHLLNLVHYFAGDPLSCSATIFADGKPATANDVVEGAEEVGLIAGNEIHARYEMANGVPLFFDSIENAGTREAGFGIQFVGTEGIIDLRADREPLAHLLAGSPFQPTPDPGSWQPVTSGGVGLPEPVPEIRRQIGGHHAAIHDLIAAIEEDRPTLCNEEDGRTVVAMTMAAFASHVEDGRRIAFPLEEKQNPFLRFG